jgi:DnaJ-class molecular chaperone
MDDRDYYADLGLTLHATTSQIKAAFHTLAMQHHPDKSGSSDASAFRCIREAFEKLSDMTFKIEYDRNYHRRRMQFDADVESGPTRTAAYEAEAAQEAHVQERTAAEVYQEMLRRSPPPKKPARKFNETGRSYYLSRAYTAWEKRDALYHQKHPTYDQA